MTVDGNQTSRIGGWGRIAVVFGIRPIDCLDRCHARSRLRADALQRLSIADDAQRSCQERREKDCSGVWMRAYFEAEKRQRDTPDPSKARVA